MDQIRFMTDFNSKDSVYLINSEITPFNENANNLPYSVRINYPNAFLL